MKIAIITQSYYPVKGGVAEHVHALSGELEKRGHEVVIITGNFTGFDDNFGRNVIRIGRDLTILANGAFCNVTISLQFKKLLEKIEKKEKFDVVHIHQPIDPVLPLLATKYLKAPKVGTFHTYQKKNFWLEMLKEPAEPYFKRLKALIAVSSSARQFISQYYKADYHIIPNGIDTKRFSPEVKPMEQYKNDKDFKILFLGRMDPRKGFKYLLRAFPLIYQKITNVKIIVVGGGIMKHWYKMALPSELSPRVDYHGFVPNDQVPRFYAACDLYCSPATRGESFGIVLLEAMASGKPVVASNIHGYNSIVKDGQTGFLVEKKNPLALAESIIKLAKNKEMRNNMEKFAREEALKYDWKKVTDRIERVYKEVLS